jgi:GT2 family glycosyltransferase
MWSERAAVSVVVLSWNRCESLQESLRRVEEELGGRGQVIVVDNGSSDGSPEMVRREFPRAELVVLPSNVGVAALNVGITASRGEVVVLLDDDSYPLPGAFRALQEVFAGDPMLGIAACRIESPVGAGAHWPGPGVPAGAEVVTFVGCGAGLRREIFARSGMFDGRFFLYANELDLALRVANAGYTVRYFPCIAFYHAVSPSNRSTDRAEYYGTRNIIWVLWKYLPPQEAVQLTGQIVLGRVLHRLAKGDLRRARAAVRGARDAVLMGLPRRQAVLGSPLRIRLRRYLDEFYPLPWTRWLRTNRSASG